jgi:bifunctional DNase/RNase
MSARVEMVIRNIVPAHSHGAYTLYLKELNGNRILPIIIGGFEAQAISMELEGMKPSRPLTHDLFTSALKEFDITVTEINIERLEEGIYFSGITCLYVNDETSKLVVLDARTSDAIALGIKFRAPIFCMESILVEAAYSDEHMDDDIELPGQQIDNLVEPKEKILVPSGYAKLSLEELEHMLDEAINDEDYAKAAKIRDELKRRN